jgi:ribosomal protein S10
MGAAVSRFTFTLLLSLGSRVEKKEGFTFIHSTFDPIHVHSMSRLTESGCRCVQYSHQLVGKPALSRLPTKFKRFSILKSPFKYHKHFEAFQFKTYKRLVTIKDLPFEEEGHIQHILNQVVPIA